MSNPEAAPVPRWTRRFWVGGSVFAGVLLLRLVALSQFVSTPAAEASGGDVAFYHHWAQRIAAGELTDGRAFYALPLYAYWLAGLYSVFGVDAFVPGLLQCAADAGTALLLFRIVERAVAEWRFSVFPNHGTGTKYPAIGQNVAGCLAAAAWAFYLPAQAFTLIRMPTALAVFAFWLVVWHVVKRSDAPRLTVILLLGVLIGFTAMAVATILFVAPLLVAALFLKWPVLHRNRSRYIVAASALLLVGIGVGSAPCWLHNTVIARDRVFLSAHSGINFWIGNNPDANGYPRFGEVRAGQADMLRDSIGIAEAAVGKPLKRSEVSAYWSERARSYIMANVGSWTRLAATKIWNFWNAFQYDDLSVVSKLREQGVILPGIGFGVVAALALAGLPFVLRTSVAARWAFAAVVLQMISLLPVFVTERYRHAAVPGLLVLAVVGLCALWRFFVSRQLGKAGAYFALLTIAAFVVSSPPTSAALWALDPYNAGREALDVGNLNLAQQKLELAYRFVPRNAELALALGNLWLERGDPDKARNFYRLALSIDSRHKAALSNLGVLALQEQNWSRAIRLFEAAIEVEPADAKSHYLLARALLGSGDRVRARAEAEAAVQLDAAQPEYADLRQEILTQSEPTAP